MKGYTQTEGVNKENHKINSNIRAVKGKTMLSLWHSSTNTKMQTVAQRKREKKIVKTTDSPSK